MIALTFVPSSSVTSIRTPTSGTSCPTDRQEHHSNPGAMPNRKANVLHRCSA